MEYLKRTPKQNYLIVEMNRPKVNALNFDMVEEIRQVFKEVEEDDSVRGIILTGMPGIFSAGLDLIELYDYDETKMRNFFIAFGTMHLELVAFSKPFIAAITGHSPAGGTVIALGADYRIMAEGEKYSMGLNEMAVNVQISNNLITAYSFWLGRSLAYRYILAGKLLTPPEALAANLVDEVQPMEEVLPRAEKRMQHYLQADKAILKNTKAKLRKPWLDQIDWKGEAELEQALAVWWSPEVRQRMQFFIAMLKSKKKT